MSNILNVSVSDEVKAQEIFGRLQDSFKKAGIGGTLHLTQKQNSDKLISMAWELSKQTGLPVVVIVRAS